MGCKAGLNFFKTPRITASPAGAVFPRVKTLKIGAHLVDAVILATRTNESCRVRCVQGAELERTHRLTYTVQYRVTG